MTRVLELAREFFEIHRFDIAQPELTFLPVRELRKFMKASRNVQWNRAVKALVHEVEAQSTSIRTARAKVNFGPADADQCNSFMQEERTRHRQKLLVKAGILSARASSQPAQKQAKSTAVATSTPKETTRTKDPLQAHVDSVADTISASTKKTKRKKTAKQTQASGTEDVVTEFAMWSSDEDSDDADADDGADAEADDESEQ